MCMRNNQILKIVCLFLFVYEFLLNSFLLKRQRKGFEKREGLLRSLLIEEKTIKHDIKNHLIMLNHFLKNERYLLAHEYMANLINSDTEADAVNSGNIIVDGILGSKFCNAQAEGIELESFFCIPGQLTMAYDDLVVILGNLADNALEAVRRLKRDERKIKVIIKYDRNCLFIRMTNTYDGRIKKDSRGIHSTKKNGYNHGIGLHNIQKAIKKYNGWMDLEEYGNTFSATIGLYMHNKY